VAGFLLTGFQRNLPQAYNMIKEYLIKFLFNVKMERYGHMLKFEMNTEDKSMSAEILLRGEVAPIQIHVGHYEILTGEESGIKVSNIHTSREWITELIQEFVPERVIKFNHAKLLKMIF
jgi:hypothetical protein